MTALTCFETDMIEESLGAGLNLGLAQRLARAFAQVLGAERVVVGHDAGVASARMSQAVKAGLVEAGVEVLDLGLSGAEEMYHATAYFEADGGIAVTAWQASQDCGGFKMVKAGAAPLDRATDSVKIEALAQYGIFAPPRSGGSVRPAKAARGAYVRSVLSFVELPALRPMTILVNAGNGAAGPTIDALAAALSKRRAPLSFICLNHDPASGMLNAISDPLLPENQPMTGNAVVAAGADMGIAWDGDFGRCLMFDHAGRCIPSSYIVGLLAEAFLAKEKGATIIHDEHLLWNTQEIVTRLGGTPVMAPLGHEDMQHALRNTGAIYGGGTSAHHYFRDFACCDSGMIPWVLIAELMSRRGVTLADLVHDRMAAFPTSGEITFRVTDVGDAVARVAAAMEPQAIARDDTDGLSLDMGKWRFILRTSNSEPLLQLNVESRGDRALVAASVNSLRGLITGQG